MAKCVALIPTTRPFARPAVAVTRTARRSVAVRADLNDLINSVSVAIQKSPLANGKAALAKLQAILDGAAQALVPVEADPAKARQVAKQIKAANENRLVGKRMKADKKKDRRAKIEW